MHTTEVIRRILACAVGAVLVAAPATPCFADFQYAETSKVTGGSMLKMMKVAGVFSKDAKQITQGMNSIVSVKGNRMRRDDGQGNAEIFDLDHRQIIHIDAKHKTYSVMTFDEMRAAIEEARRKAAEQQAKQKGQKTQVKLTPKLSVTPGQGSKVLLDHTARETKMRMDMEMQSDDPKAQGQTVTMWFTSDAWLATVKGYDELKRFNLKLAKELDWLPGTVLGGNVQIAPAMAEFQKDSAKLEGFPLLQLVSYGMVGQQGTAQQDDKGSSGPAGSVARGIGGVFGLGKKKKKDDAAPQDDKSSGADSKNAPTNSFMDMTIEVTSISADSLDASLFNIPDGYKKVDAKLGSNPR